MTLTALSSNLILYHLHNLFPMHDEFPINGFVGMVVTAEPIVEFQLLPNFFQKVCESIVAVSAITQRIFDATGGTVGDDVVYLAIDTLQIATGLLLRYAIRGFSSGNRPNMAPVPDADSL